MIRNTAPTDGRADPGAIRASVVVPARNCPATLRRTLAALMASDLPRADWELIVVDDSSVDATPDMAREMADIVVTVTGGPRGPAFARNRGAEVARGATLVFVDADVCVHPDAVRRLVELLEIGTGAPSAAFGAYDTHPEAAGIVSQYRNLLHHYVHQTNAGPADTFWAGCGAVRRASFMSAGMFDQKRFPRPQIEDIDFGYRLTDHGEHIVLVPDIQGTHLKHWTLGRMLATDYADRAVPWMRLMLERRSVARPGSLNLRLSEKVFTALTGIALMLVVVAVVMFDARYLVAAAVALVPVMIGNRQLVAWFGRERGIGFAVAVVPLRLLFYLTSGAGAASAIVLHLTEQLRRAPLAFRGVTQ